MASWKEVREEVEGGKDVEIDEGGGNGVPATSGP